MIKITLLRLLQDTRADYAATLRDNHVLARRLKPLELDKLPIIRRLDEAIAELDLDLRVEYPGLMAKTKTS